MKMLKLVGIRGGGGQICLLISAIAALSVSFGAFAEDAYIESDGTQFINTGYYPSGKTKIEVDFQLTEAKDGSDCVFGNYGDPNFSVLLYAKPNVSSKQFQFCGKDEGWSGQNSGVAVDTTRHTMVIDVPKKQGTMFAPDETIQGQAKFKDDWTYTKTAAWPIALFASCNNASGTSARQHVKAKIYGVKIWESDDNGENYTLLHDYSPVVNGGVAGFEDVKGGGFYTCDGLVASENTAKEMTGPAYIESNGGTYSIVDTRYFPNYKTKVEVDFQMVSVQSGVVPFGEYGASGFTMFLFCNTESPVKFRPQAQDATYRSGIDTPKLTCDVARHKLVMDVPARNIEMQRPGGAVEVKGRMPDSETYTGTSSWPLTLFGSANNAYGTTQKNAKARIYEVKIWEKSDNDEDYTLCRHFVPAVQGGVAGFYEKCSGKFNSGEGLTAGGKIDECDEQYIENNTSSKGSFDTGLKVTDKTKIVCDFMPLSDANQKFPFEAGDATSATNGAKRMYMRTYGNGKNFYAYACGSKLWVESAIRFRPYIRRELTLDAKNNQFIIGSPYDNAVQTMTIAAFDCPNESSNTLKIFSNGTANGNYLQGRLYSFKVYEDDALVGDYVPICQGGTYGLVDKVSGKVLTKASGSVAFAGLTSNNALNEAFFEASIRAEDAYIESDGTQGIDMSYFTTPQTRYEIDYQMTAIRGQNRPFGAAVGDLSAELYIQGEAVGSGNVAFGVGNTWVGQTTGVASDLNRHVAVLDLANRECGYSGKGMFAFSSDTICNRNSSLVMSLFTKGTSATFGGGEAKHRTAMKLYAFRIYEAGKLVHEWLPYKNGDVVGIYDTMTGEVKTNDIAGGNAFTYGGGLGYGKFAGTKTDLVIAPGNCAVSPNGAKTLSAYAPGATSYKWTRNGEVVDGATGGELTVYWTRPKDGPVVYGVTPVFTKNGEQIEGKEVTAEVTNEPQGLMILVR